MSDDDANEVTPDGEQEEPSEGENQAREVNAFFALTLDFRSTSEALRDLLIAVRPTAAALDDLPAVILSSLEHTDLTEEEKHELVAELVRDSSAPQPDTPADDQERLDAPPSSDEPAVEAPVDEPTAEDGQTLTSAAAAQYNGEEIEGPLALDDTSTTNHTERDEPVPKGDASAQLDTRELAIARLFRTKPEVLNRVAWGLARRTAAPREVILLQSLLVVAVASFESLLAAVMAQHYLLHPNALGANEGEFSLADLIEMQDLDTAREVAISRRVESFMRSGLDDWSKMTERLLGVSFGAVCGGFDSLNEVFQRRHAIVHSGARVSRQYLAKVKFGAEPSVLGERLFVSDDYLRSALDMTEALGAMIAFAAWIKWRPEDHGVAESQFGEQVFVLMLDGRWEAVECLCKCLQELEVSAGTRAVLAVNLYLARKRQGDQSVHKEVEQWDTTALARRFGFARAALLDDLDELFGSAEALVNAGEIRLTDVATWPLLEEMRADARYTQLLRTMTGTARQSESGP